MEQPGLKLQLISMIEFCIQILLFLNMIVCWLGECGNISCKGILNCCNFLFPHVSLFKGTGRTRTKIMSTKPKWGRSSTNQNNKYTRYKENIWETEGATILVTSIPYCLQVLISICIYCGVFTERIFHCLQNVIVVSN